MIPDFKDCTLQERQQYYYNAAHCIYCQRETEYIRSDEVYQEYYGMLHICKRCSAHVGCIPNSDQSMGTVARKTLRNLRIECHKQYDPLIDAKVNQLGTKRKQAQAQGRQWLANYLNIEIEACHIGYFTEEQCIMAIEKCKSLYPTEEQIKRKQSDIQYRIDVVHFKASELGFEFKEFPIMGKVQMELKHFNGKVFYFDPVKKMGRWQSKKKPSPIEDIEEFINANFQPI